MTERERLIELIIASVDGCAERWASRIADHLLTNGVRLIVTCGECRFCVDMGIGGLYCEHPDNRNPIGCNPKEYCDRGERREDNGT